MNECTDDELMTIIKDLENGKASDIPIKLIKRSSHVISPIHRQYYNILMCKGEFPDTRKRMRKNLKTISASFHIAFGW